MTHHTKTITTSASGTDSINLPDVPAAAVSNVAVTSGWGQVTVEPVGSGCRLMVTGGILDGRVTVEWDQVS